MEIKAMDNGGYNVGYITAGEYLRYTVDVTQKNAGHEHKAFRHIAVRFIAFVAVRRCFSSSGPRLGPPQERHVKVDVAVVTVTTQRSTQEPLQYIQRCSHYK